MSLQVKAGVEARVKAALSQATQLQTDMEELREAHALELSITQQQIAAVQQDLADQHEHSQDLTRQLSDACQTVTRCGAQLHSYKKSLHVILETCVVATCCCSTPSDNKHAGHGQRQLTNAAQVWVGVKPTKDLLYMSYPAYTPLSPYSHEPLHILCS